MKCANPVCDLQAVVKYCSRRCSVITNNSLRKKRSILCVRCGSRILGKGIKFCSTVCANEFQKETNLQLWLGGFWDGNTKAGLARLISEYLKQQSDWSCSSKTCAVPGGFRTPNPVTGRVPLEINHIDGDAYNNHPSNLEVLCLNCHGLTSNYRALNKNGTRKTRKNNYK